MKLRIRGNSIRMRLSRRDLEMLVSSGAVEERLSFPSGQMLGYRLERTATPVATAELRDHAVIAIGFPAEAIQRWAEPDEISLLVELPLGDGQTLSLLVEKDYRCLSPREDEDDADLFANPGA
jgi:hypothetical protein